MRPDSPCSTRVAVLVVDPDHGVVRRLAGRARGLAHVPGLGDRGPGDLGRAVGVVEVVAERVHPLRWRGHRAAPSPTRRRPRSFDQSPERSLLGELHDPLHHHRDHDQRVARRASGWSRGSRPGRTCGAARSSSRAASPCSGAPSPRCGTAARRCRWCRRSGTASSRAARRHRRGRTRRAGRPWGCRSCRRSGSPGGWCARAPGAGRSSPSRSAPRRGDVARPRRRARRSPRCRSMPDLSISSVNSSS